jgi:hypothetical protein
MLIDNTDVMGAGFPKAALRRKGLMGLGQFDTTSLDPTVAVDPSGSTSASAGSDLASTAQSLLTGLNAEALYIINLQRAQQGQAPLSASTYSPQVNVGVAPATRNTVLIVAALALGGVFLLSRKR